ncbi:helix-turn-helix domain-containing protein [Nocardioides marmoribigeumensis]|jgi:transcriptional regulator with XRE-family HTH domain|uniref:Transcriptional regulator with XRE-family HTH domain n=1 Tax=Nocardioides marmoribigeumensis TaxID=433649 RepID=A0ABU2BPG3_9ACTN|nr:helix-turn-helix transcriptional regulator [Nocardioides marmoribigeumensis]MDR7360510.1 transcriptional regulator with XRE-family HTH domain [Nocardioides marmoribigeumensis]
MVLFRRLLGEVLRARRLDQGRSLRDLCAEAAVSLGYMSEIERGQKEASSELLASICAALDAPLSEILSEVADAVALEETRIGLRLADEIAGVELSAEVSGNLTGHTDDDVVPSAA